ncbi:MAG: methyltransferase domain-containing protein [Caldilineaceae bacterium]
MLFHTATHTHAPETQGNVIRWAHFYDPCVKLLTLGRAKALRQKTVALAQIQPGDQVLEVGCGTGDVALAAQTLAGADGQVYGIDPATEMIETAQRKAAQAHQAVTFQVGVIEQLAFPDQSFDVVLSSLMMHHLPDALKSRGLAEIVRVLKPGGRLLIVDFKRPTSGRHQWLSLLFLHNHMPTGLQDLPALLTNAGFSEITVGNVGFMALGFVRAQVAR